MNPRDPWRRTFLDITAGWRGSLWPCQTHRHWEWEFLSLGKPLLWPSRSAPASDRGPELKLFRSRFVEEKLPNMIGIWTRSRFGPFASQLFDPRNSSSGLLLPRTGSAAHCKLRTSSSWQEGAGFKWFQRQLENGSRKGIQYNAI